MVATMDAPDWCCRSTVYRPMNESSRTVSGMVELLVVRVSAAMNSFVQRPGGTGCTGQYRGRQWAQAHPRSGYRSMAGLADAREDGQAGPGAAPGTGGGAGPKGQPGAVGGPGGWSPGTADEPGRPQYSGEPGASLDTAG
jgi:hypothetical protein